MTKSDEEIKLVRDWLKFAKENILFANSGIDEDFSPYHTICFLCQGSGEKYLKAYLIWNEWELKKTHDLVELLGYCIDIDPGFEDLKEECLLLNEYIIEGRYPGDLSFESITKKEAQHALSAVDKIESLVLAKIDLPDEGNNKKTPPTDSQSDEAKKKALSV